jgi:N-acetylglucosaminyldiphosphoundecaprenol N-acetyl-beta-D-mannosaminyltransferase
MPYSVDSVDILGVPVSAITMDSALETIEGWIEQRESNFVCVRDAHGIVQCQTDAEFRDIHVKAGLVAPDGVPLVWLSWIQGCRHVRRVCGTDLMLELCRRSAAQGHRHFFYGTSPAVLERLCANLRASAPGLRIVGTHSPPFRPLSEAEDREIIDLINASGADVVWVGLSSPKQEQWMAEHVDRLKAPVMIGVGAAFDFHAGTKKRAPKWMQRSGLEWSYRLASEPRRLWSRYWHTVPRFLLLSAGTIITEKLMRGGGSSQRFALPPRTRTSHPHAGQKLQNRERRLH